MTSFANLVHQLGSLNPAPYFVLSLLPYLAFLWWARQVTDFPKIALWGFKFTLVFVFVTIGASIIAEQHFQQQLADVDFLHGGAEAFLTLANILVLLGFANARSTNFK